MDTVTKPSARTEIVSDAVEKMLTQFQHSPLQRVWVSAIATELQLLESQAVIFWISMMLSDAANTQLDIIGKIVGEKRYGRTDDDYRLAIAARIRINRGNGTTEEILGILSNALDRKYVLRQRYPAGLTVDVIGAVTEAESDALISILRAVKGAGISVSLSYQTSEYDGLTLSSDPDTVETDTAKGLADDAGTTGGRLLELKK